MTDPTDPERPGKRSFTWRVEHTIATVIFFLALFGVILLNSFG